MKSFLAAMTISFGLAFTTPVAAQEACDGPDVVTFTLAEMMNGAAPIRELKGDEANRFVAAMLKDRADLAAAVKEVAPKFNFVLIFEHQDATYDVVKIALFQDDCGLGSFFANKEEAKKLIGSNA